MILFLGIFALARVRSAAFVEIDTSEVDRYYDFLLKYGQPSRDLTLELGVAEGDDLQTAVDRIKAGMGLEGGDILLTYHVGKTPPAYIENKNGSLKIYFSREVKQKKEQINVLTHELGHIYVWDLEGYIPEGYDEEKIVDSSSAYLGLGILVLNGLTDDTVFLPGGISKTEKKFFGYLRPEQFGYLVARYCAEHGIMKENVAPFLTSTGRKYFNIGCNYLAQQNNVAYGSVGEATGGYWCPRCGHFTRVSLAEKINGLKCPDCSWTSTKDSDLVSSFLSSSGLAKPVYKFVNNKSAALVVMLSGADRSAFFFLNHKLAAPACDKLIRFFMTVPGEFLIILIGVAALFARAKYTKYSALIFLSSYAISRYSYHAIKYIVKRPRPFEALDNVRLLLGPNDGFSFPSGHATIAFCLATVAAARYPKVRYPAFMVAILIALFRPYLGVHYPSDILAGALLGIFIGYVVAETAVEHEKIRKK